MLPKDNARIFVASRHPDLCTTAGMKQSFQEMARQVGDKGLFVFHFSGHGLKVGNEWGLAPADFDYSDATFVTGSQLNLWLHEAKCRATHVLVILDCCYAGGLGHELTSDDLYLYPGLYVLSACTAYETSLVIGPLGHSIFAYFLAYALRMAKFHAGMLPIEKVFEECGALSTALSSLLVSYNADTGLRTRQMNPELHFFEPVVQLSHRPSWVMDTLRSIERENSSSSSSSSSSGFSLPPTVRHFEFVLRYYRSKNGSAQPELCDACFGWLQSVGELNEASALSVLERRGLLLVREVLCAVVCCMMWSVASILVDSDIEHVSDRNLFLIGFLYAASELGKFRTPVLGLEHLKESLEFYQAVLERNKVEHNDIKLLLTEIERDQAMAAVRPLEVGFWRLGNLRSCRRGVHAPW